MDALSLSGLQLSPVRHFEDIINIRAERHEHMRGRNNVTSCRSPTREMDSKLMKRELKERRHLEFLRRRTVSPERCDMNVKPVKVTNSSSRKNTFAVRQNSSSTKSETLLTNMLHTSVTNGHLGVRFTPKSNMNDEANTNKWASLWSDQVTVSTIKESNQLERSNNAQRTSVRTFSRSVGKSHHSQNVQAETTQTQRKTQRDASVQTECGFVTVRESEIQRLAEYLKEALWREEVVKQKLLVLQESTSTLTHSSHSILTARCSEDLLRNKIKALEAQLLVCQQKFPKDGVKRLVLQMEKQKLLYEEKALVSLQRATQEKTEALSKAETLQEALITAKAEALRWQSVYEELKLSCGQLRESHNLHHEQLQQLHSQLEWSKAREAELREDVVSLKGEKKELEFNMYLLEEDNLSLREEGQQLRDGSTEMQDFMAQASLKSEEAERRQTAKRSAEAEEQLRLTQDKLRLKESECEELQTELHVMEQECQSSQARLTQCRDELRQLSHRRRTQTLCGSCWRVCVFFALLLAVVGVAMLWLWHPPFREQMEDLYSDIETRVEDYLMEMHHSACFRPI
ncbi:uncharacterized protein traf3ip3 [Genypterus blacodes]|uniref:uncharacterized protein traf3ip3 n=1 Tax=Genypterus blacodes TaxID=154954 RepID=UPI003F76DE46